MRDWGSCAPVLFRRTIRSPLICAATVTFVSGFCGGLVPVQAQNLMRAPDEGESIQILPSDLAVLESEDLRKDLPCSVTQRKPELGFDLRFHAGYEVTVPMQELSGSGDLLTVVFRVYAGSDKLHPVFFAQHFKVPTIEDDAKGDAYLRGQLDLGPGAYHVDWLMRDRSERFCSSGWDMNADLNPHDKPIPLFLPEQGIDETLPEPFVNDTPVPTRGAPDGLLNVKLLVNFAPQSQSAASLQRTDVDALVTILKEIQRDPRIGRISLVAFNITESRVVYRQEAADHIDFPALGKALRTMHLGTVNVQNLNKLAAPAFLENLVETEVGAPGRPDAVIFAGPKAMLDADVPPDDLRRIGDIECPVFYLNYNLDPQGAPWKDSISHVIRAFRGIEYTISRPRDVWFSTADVLGRIVRFKSARAPATASLGTLPPH